MKFLSIFGMLLKYVPFILRITMIEDCFCTVLSKNCLQTWVSLPNDNHKMIPFHENDTDHIIKMMSAINCLIYGASKTYMFLVSSCRILCAIYWNQLLSRELWCSWNSADRWCSNYIWMINNFIAYYGATYIRDFRVLSNNMPQPHTRSMRWCFVIIQCFLRMLHAFCCIVLSRAVALPSNL